MFQPEGMLNFTRLCFPKFIGLYFDICTICISIAQEFLSGYKIIPWANRIDNNESSAFESEISPLRKLRLCNGDFAFAGA